MRKFLMVVFTMVFALAVAGVSFAAEAEMAKETKEKAAPKAEMMKMMGTVKSIDRKKGELVVAPEGGAEMTFKIKKTQAKDVKEGEMVSVSYEKKGEEMVAKRVMKHKMKKEGVKKEEKKTEEMK